MLKKKYSNFTSSGIITEINVVKTYSESTNLRRGNKILFGNPVGLLQKGENNQKLDPIHRKPYSH